MIGASGLTPAGITEAVRGFAAVKRAMLAGSETSHLLVDSGKFGRRGLSQVGCLSALSSVVTDRAPEGDLAGALATGGVGLEIVQ